MAEETTVASVEVTQPIIIDLGKQKPGLLSELKKDSLERPFVDLFISTHPHDDHCK